jgi:hypothetical protein
VFGIDRTRENRVRFLKRFSLLGMALLTMLTGVVFLWGK